MRKLFNAIGDFAACREAEAWLRERGFSVGRMQGPAPRGILRGDVDIQKWRNLSAGERRALDGRMTGNMRNGPVCIEISDEVISQVAA